VFADRQLTAGNGSRWTLWQEKLLGELRKTHVNPDSVCRSCRRFAGSGEGNGMLRCNGSAIRHRSGCRYEWFASPSGCLNFQPQVRAVTLRLHKKTSISGNRKAPAMN